jgi:hypothetical protein
MLPTKHHERESSLSPNGLTPHVAHEIGADRIRAAEHHRLVVESRPARAAGRSPLALRSRLRPARRQAVAKLAEPADA